MNRMLGLAVLMALLVSCEAVAGPDGNLDKLMPTYLVSAEVVSVGKGYDDYTVKAEVKITHVYRGPEDLAGRLFTAVSSKKEPEGSWAGMQIFPPLSKGEKGIWSLRANEQQLAIDRLVEIVPFLSREGITKDFEQMKAFAETLEKYESARGERRIALVRRSVESRSPQVSEWAVRALPMVDEKGGAAYLRKVLQDDQVSMLTEVAIDGVLSDNDKSWSESKERRQLYREWLTTRGRDTGAQDLARALDTMSRSFAEGHLDRAYYFSLLKLGVENVKLPPSGRKACIRLMGHHLDIVDPEEQAKRFSYLVALIRQRGVDGRLRAEAGKTVGAFKLNPDRVNVLRKLLTAQGTHVDSGPSFGEAEVWLDVVLCRHDKSWPKSKDEKSLYRKWVSHRSKGTDLPEKMTRRILSAYRERCINDRDLFDLMKLSIQNNSFPTDVRKDCVAFLADTKQVPDSFEYLVNLVEKDESSEMRETAARIVTRFPLDARRRATLRRVAETAKDGKVAKMLIEAISSPEDAP